MWAAPHALIALGRLGPLEDILDSPAPGPFLAILGGFVLAIYGHGAKMRWLVAAGIVIVFVGSIMLFIAAGALDERPLPSVVGD
jgi:hypothetical protein